MLLADRRAQLIYLTLHKINMMRFIETAHPRTPHPSLLTPVIITVGCERSGPLGLAILYTANSGDSVDLAAVLAQSLPIVCVGYVNVT